MCFFKVFRISLYVWDQDLIMIRIYLLVGGLGHMCFVIQLGMSSSKTDEVHDFSDGLVG